MEANRKIPNHLFDLTDEIEKCKEDPLYFFEKYWLPYSLGIKNVYTRDVDEFILRLYWESQR